MMDAQALYERMKKVQEPKGYYFNADNLRTSEFLNALLVNRERYKFKGGRYLFLHLTVSFPQQVSLFQHLKSDTCQCCPDFS